MSSCFVLILFLLFLPGFTWQCGLGRRKDESRPCEKGLVTHGVGSVSSREKDPLGGNKLSLV